MEKEEAKKTLGNIAKIAVILIAVVIGFFIARIYLAIYYHNKGADCYSRRSYNEAINYFKKSLNLDAGKAVVHYSIANAYFAAGMDDPALEEFNNTIRIDPLNYVKAYSFIAELYSRRQKYDEALKMLDETAVKIPANEEIRLAKEKVIFDYVNYCLSHGSDAFQAGDKATAYNLLNKAVTLKPDFVHSHYTLAFFYYSDDRLEDAAGELKAALQLDYKFWPAHKLTGDVYLKEKKYPEAIDNYRRALQGSPGNPVITNDLNLALRAAEGISEPITGTPKSEIAPPPLPLPDTVYLKNGRTMEGIIRAEDEEKIILEIEAGGSTGNIILPRSSIERISKGK
jgi:tetratricopeptide (TPR) repeat protein